MVLLDGDPSVRASSAAGKRHPLAGMRQLANRVEHLASWTTGATRGGPEQLEPQAGSAEPPAVQATEALRPGVFGWRFKRH